MKALWDSALYMLNTLPPFLAAVIVGWAMSVGLTHGMKFSLPLSLPEGYREAAARWTAFVTAAVPAGAWMANADATPLAIVMTAVCAGVWSPLAFAILQWALRLHPKTAGLADLLSGDKRGVIAAKLRGES